MNKQPAQDQTIKNIITLAKNNADVEVLWLYGVRARNTESIHGDYDLAVAFKAYIKSQLNVD